MRGGSGSRLADDLRRLFRHGPPPAGDRALLDRFLDEGDQAAFEALVSRHGPMVLGVCRRLLASPQDADDAFQATFLVLVRKAGRLRDADRLGPWLYGVASRVAAKSRAREARRRRQQVRAGDFPSREGPNHDLLDVRPILDAELGRIPAKLREVLILCLLEGATAEEASRRLNCPPGTVKSRLARGREALRTRLVGRGIAPAVALAAASSASSPASAVPASLTRATLVVISAPPAAVAAGLAALTRGVAPAMIPKLSVPATLLLGGVALAGLGTANWPEAPPVAQAPGAAQPRPDAGKRTETSKDHMKQIILAFHNYHDSNGHLPPASIHGDDGQANLSWRVALLPYLGEGGLYDEFRRDEPWDSPHNKALIARMPDVFRTPESPAPDGETRFRGFAGKRAMFDGTRGLSFDQVTDGTSNTAILALAREPVPWTRPGELAVKEDQPLPELDESDPAGWLVGMADGSVHSVPIGEKMFLRRLITRNGGEVISWPNQAGAPAEPAALPPTAPTPRAVMAGGVPGGGITPTHPPGGAMITGGGMLTPPAPSSSAIEQRLQRLEEKLDLLFQRLDSQTPGGGKPLTR